MSNTAQTATRFITTLFATLLVAPVALGGPDEQAAADSAGQLAATDANSAALRHSPADHALSNLWNLNSRYEQDDEGNWIIVSRPLALSSKQREMRNERQARQAPGIWERQRYGVVNAPSRAGNAPAPAPGASDRGNSQPAQRSASPRIRRSTTQPRRVNP